eukprot:3157646-Rhodomonas_salina.1
MEDCVRGSSESKSASQPQSRWGGKFDESSRIKLVDDFAVDTDSAEADVIGGPQRQQQHLESPNTVSARASHSSRVGRLRTTRQISVFVICSILL